MLRIRWTLALAAASTLAFAASTEAATTEIGSVAQITANLAPAPAFFGGATVQISAASGRSYTVPAGYGVITRFRHRTGFNSGSLDFKVYRPTGAAAEFTSIASETYPVNALQVESFDTRIPVQPGDTLGLNAAGGPGAVLEAYSGVAGDNVGFFPGNPPLGGTSTASPGNVYFLDVAARVETDADGDGYGDDTQDGCPTDAADHTACSAETVINVAPKDKVKTKKKKAKIKYAFSSPQPNVTFECSLDGEAFAACASPLQEKLGEGRYFFQVRAVNSSGEPDATPESDSFKIKRKRKKP